MADGPCTLRELRELFVYAAWLSELLAWLSHDLGDPMAAEAWAVDSFQHAEEAGHDELCAWAMDAMASIAIYTGRPGKAVAAARAGIAKAPLQHPLAVRLRAQAARAHARLGQREDCEGLLLEAAGLYERLPARAPMRFALDTGTLAGYAMTAYAASSYIWLGDDGKGDFENARMHAQAAVAAHEAAALADRSPSREAIARIDLGIALAALGEPDQAAALGHEALASVRLVDSVRSRAGDLDRVLIARHPGVAGVRDFHEEYAAVSGHGATGGRP
jgi:tetratricopeptide (TPR) repeat protein